MAETDNRNATDWDLIGCTIKSQNGTTIDLSTKLIQFDYFESLERLNPVAKIMFNDQKTEMTVTEGDEVRVLLKTSAHSDDEIEHIFFVEKIAQTTTDGATNYTCNLVTKESKVISEYTAKKSYRGPGAKILQEVFDDSGYGTTVQLVADSNKPYNPLVIDGAKRKLPMIAYDVVTQSIPESGKGKNTCGYFLWGTKKNLNTGFNCHFKSIDSLLSVGAPHNGADHQYSYYQATEAASLDMPNQLIIKSFQITNRGNFKKMADQGVFLANMLITDLDKKKYKEKKWNITEHWSDWGHIAQTEGSPPWRHNGFLKEHVEKEEASKTFVIELSHERYHDKEEPAASDSKKDGQSQAADFQDWDADTVVQYKARRATMGINVSNVVVPGNQNLNAGDKIKLYLRDSAPDAVIGPDGYSKEHSGHYLIYKIRHVYANIPKKECWTMATLVRDTINKNC